VIVEAKNEPLLLSEIIDAHSFRVHAGEGKKGPYYWCMALLSIQRCSRFCKRYAYTDANAKGTQEDGQHLEGQNILFRWLWMGYRISDGEVKIATITLRWNDGIEFSCMPYKLCECAECAFPEVHLAILSLALFVLMIRHTPLSYSA